MGPITQHIRRFLLAPVGWRVRPHHRTRSASTNTSRLTFDKTFGGAGRGWWIGERAQGVGGMTSTKIQMRKNGNNIFMGINNTAHGQALRSGGRGFLFFLVFFLFTPFSCVASFGLSGAWRKREGEVVNRTHLMLAKSIKRPSSIGGFLAFRRKQAIASGNREVGQARRTEERRAASRMPPKKR